MVWTGLMVLGALLALSAAGVMLTARHGTAMLARRERELDAAEAAYREMRWNEYLECGDDDDDAPDGDGEDGAA